MAILNLNIKHLLVTLHFYRFLHNSVCFHSFDALRKKTVTSIVMRTKEKTFHAQSACDSLTGSSMSSSSTASIVVVVTLT